jgi:hypothetical protein
MQQLKPLIKNKKGALGLDTAKDVMVWFLVLAVLAIAIILALVSLRDSGIFTANSQEDNDTTNIVGNITGALTNNFFDQTGTIFAILIVVVIMFAIGLIIYVVTRFSAGGKGGTM